MNVEVKFKEILKNLYLSAGKTEADKFAEQAISYMNGKSDKIEDLEIRAIKGGTYKIKNYYLENNDLMDIRGASSIITEVQEHIIPDILKETVGFECIIYNGGGNLFALVPCNVDTSLGAKLEQEAKKYLITADTAYCVTEKFRLSELLGSGYRKKMADIENKLGERKKAKISFDASPKSKLIGKKLMGAEVTAELLNGNDYCDKCKKRKAMYSRKTSSFAKNTKLCGGCLHKVIAGERQRKGYFTEFTKCTGKELNTPSSFTKIDKEHIAVIYADGNNMGGILQHIDKITDMMDFSSFVKSTMTRLVYESIAEREIESCEIVAVGGDDVFIIVPGKKAIRMAALLTEKYRSAFNEKYKEYKDSKSTLSVGICIAKPNTPIKVMLEVAEDELSEAKKIAREENCDGSLSYRIFNTYEGALSRRGGESMAPYSLKAINTVLKYTDRYRKKKTDIRTRLQNLSQAFKNADSSEEAELFFKYVNAKTKKERRINLPEIDGYEFDGGYYIRKGNYEADERQKAYLWNDLLNIMEFGE